MIDTQLRLPNLELKPRRRGLTMVIDPGLFTGQFEDAIDSVGEFVDFVKFGWGTCLITKDIKRKIDILRSANIDFYFGGTLFERFALDATVIAIAITVVVSVLVVEVARHSPLSLLLTGKRRSLPASPFQFAKPEHSAKSDSSASTQPVRLGAGRT